MKSKIRQELAGEHKNNEKKARKLKSMPVYEEGGVSTRNGEGH